MGKRKEALQQCGATGQGLISDSHGNCLSLMDFVALIGRGTS